MTTSADPEHGTPPTSQQHPQWSPLPAAYPPGLDPYGHGPASAAPGAFAPPLDQAMAALGEQDPRPWGWRPVLVPITALVALVVLGSIATRVIRPSTFDGKLAFAAALNLSAEGLLAVSVVLAGRSIASRYGGWGPVFGWRVPRWADVGYAAAGVGITFVARIAISVVANLASHGTASKQAQNLHLHTTSFAVVALLVFLTVLCAPVVEEVMFRGLLLRTFMRRLGFWPAAIASTVIFAGFHTYEVNTLVGAVTLAAAIAAMGLTNCVLVRLTTRLTPGIGVHAALNALAVVVLIAQAAR